MLVKSSQSVSDADILREYASRWTFQAHEGQIPPSDRSWFCYLMRSGRGGGKTRAGAEWVLQRVRDGYKSIALIGANAADVRDIMVELGESSICKVARPEEVPVYEPSKRRLTFPNGAVAVAFSDETPDQLRGPQHDSCFVHGSMILSSQGSIPIQEINKGDLVLTRAGFKKVGSTISRYDNVGKVIFSNGIELIGTTDHPILTTFGWISLGDLKKGDIVACLSDGEKEQTDILSDIPKEGCYINIDTFGKMQTGRSLLDIISTIKTKIKEITNYPISNVQPQNHIESIITKSQNELNTNVQIVDQKSSELKKMNALPHVGNVKIKEQSKNVNSQKSVYTVENRSIQDLGIIAASVVSTWAPVGIRKIYNLSILDQPEYFVNGILVHNCWIDELAKFKNAQETWDNLLMGLRLGKNPQVFITTTPRPTPLLKELLKSPDTIDVRFSTFDNADNLSPKFLAKVKEKYEGTRLGRQELEGEILDDNPEALWQRAIIENLRIRPEACPQLTRVVIGVDPAVTSGKTSDDTGIIAAGIGINGHGYILGDHTIHGTPHDWALETVKAFRRFQADRVIGEVNNGGDLVEVNIRTVNPNIPFYAVHASRGKAIRAEPVSGMYEQGRIHHVGTFPELEDQLCEWVPGDKSPDRMDALVWAIWELFNLGEDQEMQEIIYQDTSGYSISPI